jgi:hypothetical protein
LHARYTRDSLGDDLIFKEATPIAGGRELRLNAELETGAVSSLSNAFQGRYAVRHPWTGPVACAEPVRNVWGPPPSGLDNGPAKAARDLAYAPRGGNVQLASFLRSDVAALDVKAAGAMPSGVGPAPAASTSPAGGAGADDAGGTDGIASSPAVDAKKSSCLGCATAPSGSGLSSIVAALGLLAAAVARLYARGRSR